MAAPLKDKRSSHYFLAYRSTKKVTVIEEGKKVEKQSEGPESVTFVIAGKKIVIPHGEASDEPLESLLAHRMLAKSKQWYGNNAVITLEPVKAASGAEAKAKAEAEAKAKAEAEAKAKAGQK